MSRMSRTMSHLLRRGILPLGLLLCSPLIWGQEPLAIAFHFLPGSTELDTRHPTFPQAREYTLQLLQESGFRHLQPLVLVGELRGSCPGSPRHCRDLALFNARVTAIKRALENAWSSHRAASHIEAGIVESGIVSHGVAETLGDRVVLRLDPPQRPLESPRCPFDITVIDSGLPPLIDAPTQPPVLPLQSVDPEVISARAQLQLHYRGTVYRRVYVIMEVNDVFYPLLKGDLSGVDGPLIVDIPAYPDVKPIQLIAALGPVASLERLLPLGSRAATPVGRSMAADERLRSASFDNPSPATGNAPPSVGTCWLMLETKTLL